MLSGVQTRGWTYDVYLADAGIAPVLLQQAGARVTAAQYITLFRSLIERLDDECLAFLSRPLKRGSFALVARSALGANDLEAAIRRVARTFRLVQDDVVLELVREGELAGLALRFTEPSMARPTFLDEMLLRVFWRLLAWFAGGQLPTTRFDFAFPCPPHVGCYDKVFPAAPRFSQPQSAFWFVAARLKCPVRRDEAALRAFIAEAQANVILPRRGEEMISVRVREHLQVTQPTWPDLSATAEAMHMSVPTLQRRLGAEGTSFQMLKDDLRRDIAIVRLNASKVSLAALAQELGFADSAAFQRAFKGWTGSPPGTYRRGGL
ncbi:Transcriptional regulator, AraC family (plasmid) [Cupriavidus necator H850]|uniref:AraC family transcriptional regulator n=1 Tax=Cupriavidus necator TaxID=106590 RepID=UPI00129D4B1E|nr:AraC family transcriptional regulator [Cupriavidus necator]KAI3604127.1 Transcriptional regulator, AraC family [Cupriavidus necator H850]